jgi:hypothetical protein
LLPIGAIEPALAGAISVCTELPTPSGFVDNLLATDRGDLAIVECKLWRDPQARREVIGQIIEYAKMHPGGATKRWRTQSAGRHIRRA